MNRGNLILQEIFMTAYYVCIFQRQKKSNLLGLWRVDKISTIVY